MDDITKRWTDEAKRLLEGKTITAVEYMTQEEAEEAGFYCRPVCIVLDDGTTFLPQRDDEGNDAGVIGGVTPDDKFFVLPVLR